MTSSEPSVEWLMSCINAAWHAYPRSRTAVSPTGCGQILMPPHLAGPWRASRAGNPSSATKDH